VNIKRVWDLANALYNLVPRTRICRSNALYSDLERDGSSDSRIWVTANRSLALHSIDSSRYPGQWYKSLISLPGIIPSISISVVDMFIGHCVSGARMWNTNGDSWDLGYLQSCKSITVRMTHTVVLYLAEDRHCIRCDVGKNDSILEWIGDHLYVPQRYF